MTSGALLAVGFAVIGAIPSAASATTATATPDQPRPNRVLILSLPTSRGPTSSANGLPNLQKLLADSAVADLCTRSANGSAQLGDGYATICRAPAQPPTTPTTATRSKPASARQRDRRQGVPAAHRSPHDSGLVQLGIADSSHDTTDLLFDAKIGEFGDTLAGAASPGRSIGNADGDRARQSGDRVPVPPDGRRSR